MNTTNAVYIKMANSTCCTARMKRSFHVLAMGGAQGGIGGTTNYNGKELTGIIEAWKAGDLELARERQEFRAGSYQCHLSLSWKHRWRQTHHETDRAGFRKEPDSIPKYDR